MTATYQAPAPLKTYLRRATFGLSKQRREEVWDELEEHILCRAERLQFQGLSAEQALAQALREMGPPLRVCWQLNGVHNMPKLIAFGTLIALAVSASLYAAAQTTVQLPVETKAPHTECVKTDAPQPHLTFIAQNNGYNCYQDDNKMQDGLFVSFDTFKKAFGAIGFKTEVSNDGNTVNLKGPLGKVNYDFHPTFTKDGEKYYDMQIIFVLTTMPNPFPAHFESYAQPTLVMGNKRIQVANGSKDASQLVYWELTAATIRNTYFSKGNPSLHSIPEADSVPKRTIQTPFSQGEVIVAIRRQGATQETYEGKEYPYYHFTFSLGVTDAQGKVTLQIPADAKIVSTPQSGPSNDVLLLKLTNTRLGDMKSGILHVK